MWDFVYLSLVFVSVFVIIDPFANIPIASTLLDRFPAAERQSILKKSHLIAAALFMVFSIFGNFIFAFLRIEFFAFRIAGGLLLGFIAFEMLYRIKSRTEFTPDEKRLADEKENLAVTPLAIPLITGPGAMTTGFVLFTQAGGEPSLVLFFFLAAGAAYLSSFLLFRESERILKFMGPIGMKVATRVMGLLLLSIAIQMIFMGIRESGVFVRAGT